MYETCSYQDLQQLFLGTVVLYKDKPVLVKQISADKTIKVYTLATQKVEILEKKDLKEISAPIRRLGFLNLPDGAVYMKRLPVRKWQVGISQNNVSVGVLPSGCYTANNAVLRAEAHRFDSVAHHNMIHGIYPSLKEAIDYLKKTTVVIAFDKQFAIDSEGSIYFRTEEVGKLPAKRVGIDSIQWRDGKSHLRILLGGAYEKTLSDYRISTEKR